MKQVLHNVQILRFVAAAMVLVSHLQHEVPSVRGLDAAGYVPFTPIWFAGGVDIFFVISGFIMYVIAADDFGRRGASRDFITRRLMRVVPPYWLFTTAMLAALVLFADQIAHAKTTPLHVIASYLFVPVENAYGRLYPVLILGWTLNFEMLFYVVFALGLLAPRRLGLAAIFVVIGLLGIAGWVGPPANAPFAFWCNPIVFEFLFGIGIGLLYRRGLRWSAPVAWTVAAIGLCAMVAAMASGVAGQVWPLRVVWMGLPAALVCAAAALGRDSGEASPWRRGLVVGGDCSYALYLSHPFSLTIVAMLWHHLGITHPTVYVAVGGAVSIAAAWAVHRGIEQPLLRLTQRWAGPRRRPTSPTGRAQATLP